MHPRWRTALLAVVVATVAAVASACAGRAGGALGTEYEYEEDLTIGLDGSATLVVNSSVAALAALRGLQLDTALNARADELKAQIRKIYASDNVRVGRISNWTRRGRRFVGIHLAITSIQSLTKSPPFSWATYDLHQEGEQFVYRETLSKPANAGTLSAGLTGDEIVAFRLHLPARIRVQNSRYLEKDESRPAARGNILTWEQRLRERLAGKPIAYAEDRTPDVMEARMDRQSILYRTLWLFGIAFVAAMLVIAGLIWLTMRRGGPVPSDHPR